MEQMPQQQPAPQAGSPAPDKQAKLQELNNVEPAIQLVVLSCFDIIDQRGEELLSQILQGVKTVAIGTSQMAFALIMGSIAQISSEAEAETGQKAGINPGKLVGDGGPGELVLARIFGLAEQMGVQGATDEAEYVTAGDALDLLLEMAESGGGGDPQAAMAAMQGGGEPQAPQQPQGWRQQA
jgi:hypothetical protein